LEQALRQENRAAFRAARNLERESVAASHRRAVGAENHLETAAGALPKLALVRFLKRLGTASPSPVKAPGALPVAEAPVGREMAAMVPTETPVMAG